MGEALHCRVRGIVQGVYFRAEACRQARRLGLTGWVRNCNNGDVELVMVGSPGALEQMHEWLRHGPEQARVDEVTLTPCADPGATGFDIRYQEEATSAPSD